MSSFEWNKILASILAAGIVAMVAGILASHIIAPQPLEKPAYLPPGAEAGAAAETAAATPAQPAGPEPIEAFFAKADPQKGEQLAKVCLTCHSFEKGGPNKIGPNLWGVAEEQIAAVPNYDFSAALSKHKGNPWNLELLNHWLFDPQAFAPGTKMSFPGIKNSQQRADVIAYLESLTPGGAAHLKELQAKAAEAAKAQPAAPAAKPGAAEPTAKNAGATGPSGAPTFAVFLSKADPEKGAQFAKVCEICHSFEKGAPNKIGPNLWGVAVEHIASVPNYQFSPVLDKLKAKSWTPELLNEWLTNPEKMVPGTKMTFPGLPNPQQRADVVAYLETLTPGGKAHAQEIIKKAATEAGAAPAKAPAGASAAPAAAPK